VFWHVGRDVRRAANSCNRGYCQHSPAGGGGVAKAVDRCLAQNSDMSWPFSFSLQLVTGTIFIVHGLAPLLIRADQVRLRSAQALLGSAQDTSAKQKMKSSTLNEGTMLPSMDRLGTHIFPSIQHQTPQKTEVPSCPFFTDVPYCDSEITIKVSFHVFESEFSLFDFFPIA